MDVVENQADQAVAAGPREETPRMKQCGRCRAPFEADPEGPPPVGITFWLCPPCHEALLTGKGRGRRA